MGVGAAAGVDAERGRAGGAPRVVPAQCMSPTGEFAPLQARAESEGRGNACACTRNGRAQLSSGNACTFLAQCRERARVVSHSTGSGAAQRGEHARRRMVTVSSCRQLQAIDAAVS